MTVLVGVHSRDRLIGVRDYDKRLAWAVVEITCEFERVT